MIFGAENYYFLASRSVMCYGNYASFGMYYVAKAGIFMLGTYDSDESWSEDLGVNYKLRPVVTISNDITVITNNNKNSITNMWELKK